MNSEIIQLEIQEFNECRSIMRSKEESFFEYIEAAYRIRSKKLYRSEYDTFEDFCRAEMKYSSNYVYRMLKSYETIKMLPIGNKIENESTAREVAKVPPEKREEVIKEALSENDGKLTAAAVKESAKKFPPIPTKRPDVLDGVGSIIPDKALPIWNRRKEINGILKEISSVRCAIRKAQENDDILFAEVSYSQVLAEADALYRQIKTALPYVVCPKCQGKLAENCRLCKGRGMISEFMWDNAISRDEKEIIQRRNQKAAA